jgi:hypothetical protein
MFGIYETLVEMTISSDYVGKIRSISVRNFAAELTSSNPEVWRAVIPGTANNYIVNVEDLVRGDIVVVTTDEGGGGSRDIIEISGNWDPPIVKVSYQDASQELFNVDMTKFYIVVNPALGMVDGFTVKGEAARAEGTNNTWVAVVNGKFTTISREEVVPVGYVAPVGGDLISAFNVTYSSLSFARGYNVQIRLTLAGAAGVQTIVVRDDAGDVLASLADGTLTQGASNREYGFLIPSENNDRSGMLTVEVTTANDSDDAQASY